MRRKCESKLTPAPVRTMILEQVWSNCITSSKDVVLAKRLLLGGSVRYEKITLKKKIKNGLLKNISGYL